MQHVHVSSPSFRPDWAVLVPDTAPERVLALIDEYDDGPLLALGAAEDPIEIWKGASKYTAVFGNELQQGRGHVLAEMLSRSTVGSCYLVTDSDALDGTALVFEGGEQVGARGVRSAAAFAAELGCPFPDDQVPSSDPRPFMASVVVVSGSIASPPNIERAVFREETRRGELVTLVRRAAFSGNHLLDLSRAAGERTIHCVDWTVHADPPTTYFRSSAYRGGKLVGTWRLPEQASPWSPEWVPERLVGAQTADDVLDRLGLTWADLGRE